MTKRDPEHVALDHHRFRADGWHEWSCDSTGTIAKDAPSRLFLRLEDGDFRLEDDLTTSSRPEARALESTSSLEFFLTPTMARWLAEVLPKAVAELDKQEQAAANEKAKVEIRIRLRKAIAASGKTDPQIEIEANAPPGSVGLFLSGLEDLGPDWLQRVADVVDFWAF